jgi:hypothetical protein
MTGEIVSPPLSIGQDEVMRNLTRTFTLNAGAAAIALTLALNAANAADAPAKSAAPAAMSPTMAQDDPAKVEAARNFLIAFHIQLDPKNISANIGKRLPGAVANEKARNPKLDVKKFEADIRARFMDAAVKRLDLQAHVVSRHFTLEELKGLVAFFNSPLGRKLGTETPKIVGDMMRENRLANPPKMMPLKIVPSPEKPAQKKN